MADATVWHINADEPRVFDYNVEYKSETQLSSYYGADAYRSSDHDPVIVVLDFPETSEPEPVIGDFDGDSDIDNTDIVAFYTLLLQRQATVEEHDFNNDGRLNIYDLYALMSMCTRTACAVQ